MTDIPQEILRPNGDRARLAILLIWIILILHIIMLFQEYLVNSMLRKIVQGDFYSEREFLRVATQQQVLAIIFVICFVISIVTFIQWFRRAYYNLGILAKGTLFGEGWAAGAWFVPIISLFRPYQIMKELYEKSEIYLTENFQDYIPWLKTSRVGWWWGFWITSNILGQISFRLLLNADTAKELLLVSNISMIEGPVSIILSLIAIKVVRDYASTESFLEQMIPVPNFPPLPYSPAAPLD